MYCWEVFNHLLTPSQQYNWIVGRCLEPPQGPLNSTTLLLRGPKGCLSTSQQYSPIVGSVLRGTPVRPSQQVECTVERC